MSSMFSNLVRANARALTAVSRCSTRSLSSRASLARPTLPTRLTTLRVARRWMTDDAAGGAPPRRVLYMGNLPFNMAEDDIRHELQDFGVMTSIHKGTDPVTGRPSGWAMVEFETEDAAESVIRDHLSQPFIFGGRTANIDWAKNPSVSPGGARNNKTDKSPSATLFMGSLSFQATEQDVYETFSEFGSVKRVSIGRSQEGSPRGFAHVEYFDLDSAVAAYESGMDNPIMVQGRPVVLDYQVPRPPRAARQF